MMFVFGFKFVGENFAVVAGDSAGNSAIVVLVVNDPTAAGIEPFIADQAVFVLVLEVFAVHCLSAGRFLSREPGAGESHVDPPVQCAGAIEPPS
jgi:hypothetical protein